jgi:hypothetical protein
MARWSFLLFGGDIREPFLRRMAWRIGVASLVAEFCYGFFQVGLSPTPTAPAYGLAALTFVYAAFLAYESWRYYQHSDEMVRRTLVASLAISGLLVMVCAGLYRLLELMFDLPPIEIIHVFFFSAAASIAWFIAAWKTS